MCKRRNQLSFHRNLMLNNLTNLYHSAYASASSVTSSFVRKNILTEMKYFRRRYLYEEARKPDNVRRHLDIKSVVKDLINISDNQLITLKMRTTSTTERKERRIAGKVFIFLRCDA